MCEPQLPKRDHLESIFCLEVVDENTSFVIIGFIGNIKPPPLLKTMDVFSGFCLLSRHEAPETLVRRGEHGPLAVLGVICKWRDVVCESLAIYKSSIGEEGATSRVCSRIVCGRSVTALEDLELWRISSDAAILVGLSLEDAIKVIWHRLASSGYGKLVRGMPTIQTEECLTVIHIQGRILLHLEDISPDPWPVNFV